MKKILLSVAFMLLVIPAVFNSNDISAQTVSVKVGTGQEEKKKEEPKEKSEVKPVQSSGPTLEQELKKVFGMKSETTIGGSRIENLGKYFLDKYTGQVTLVTYQRGEPVRWNILLININTGAMWAVDTKGITFSYKNTRLKYIPAVDTSW